MSAADHVSEQMKDYLPARVLRGYNINPYDLERHENYTGSGNPGDFWTDAHYETQSAHRMDLIPVRNGEESVRFPVTVFDGPLPKEVPTGPHHAEHLPTIANGHHRIAAAYAADPESLVPVIRFAPPSHFNEAVREGQA